MSQKKILQNGEMTRNICLQAWFAETFQHNCNQQDNEHQEHPQEWTQIVRQIYCYNKNSLAKQLKNIPPIILLLKPSSKIAISKQEFVVLKVFFSILAKQSDEN
jgi:hypothetical protein